MKLFDDGHMTRAARLQDELMAEQGQYWDVCDHEYGHTGQDVPGKPNVVHFLPPAEAVIEPVTNTGEQQELEVA